MKYNAIISFTTGVVGKLRGGEDGEKVTLESDGVWTVEPVQVTARMLCLDSVYFT